MQEADCTPPPSRARRILAALRRRAGPRGLFLILLGAYDVFYGWYLAAGGALLALPLLPERAWGWMWIGTGAVLAAGSLLRWDGWLFALAVVIKAAWAMEFFRQAQHHPLQWTCGAYFLVLALVVIAASAVPASGDPAPP